jgi:tRNA (guanine-N7-)-methyltransferase
MFFLFFTKQKYKYYEGSNISLILSKKIAVGSKNKLKRFKENETFSNVIQPTREQAINNTLQLKGNWKNTIFKNTNPIILELGCGKGEYTVALAKKNPTKNYIGVDIKGARFWKGAKTALEDNLPNVRFLRTQIELIDLFFNPGEVQEIWITFPDPQIKYKRTKHRLTNAAFLTKYKNILHPSGVVHLKTDSEFMHGYTLGLLHGLNKPIEYANHDVYNSSGVPEEVITIKTFYENQFLEVGKKITYIRFRV